MAEETVGWRRCPSQPSAPGCCWLPGTKKETLFFQFYFNKMLQPNMDDCNDEIYQHLCLKKKKKILHMLITNIK